MLTKHSETYVPKYPKVVEITQGHEEAAWSETQVTMESDVEQWKSGVITDVEKALIENILKLFTTSDVNVGMGYYEKLIPFFKNNEVRNMFGSFAAREGVHQRAYAMLNDTLGYDEGFYHEFLEYSEMKEKQEFMIEDIGRSMSDMAGYLAKQTLMEGVSLFASFVMLLNFDRIGKMKNMCNIVEWSMRDESMHVEGNSLVFRMFLDEHPRIATEQLVAEIQETAARLVELEDGFVDRVFAMGGADGIEAEEVKKYVRYVCDYRLKQLGIEPIFNVVENPIEWVEPYMHAVSHTNFFERVVTDYAKDNMNGSFSDDDVYERWREVYLR